MGTIVKGKVYPDIQCSVCKQPDVKEYDGFYISEEDAKETGLPVGEFVCLECILQHDEKNPVISKEELERQVDEQFKIRNGHKYGLKRGKYVDLESDIMRLQRQKKIDAAFADRLLHKLQDCPWQNRVTDIIWD
jgi:hypothetical protein